MNLPAAITPGHHLPIPRTPLVGREREVEELAALLLRPEVPLVTITGPGGAGKTRLALAAADELATSFRDGVWFVPLGALHDPALVMPTIAQALGLRDTGELPIATRLTERLAAAETLLLLDNIEQVRAAGPEIVELLRACPGVKALATSRAVLRLSVEHVYPVAGLALPDPAQGVEAALRTEAVRLFVARAQAANPSFRLDAENIEAVCAICRQLDGLPLALELAAARTRLLSPQALLAHLSQRLTLLSGGPADQPARHQTIRDAVGWSVQLMDPAERATFRRLAVFAGPFTAPLAATVTTLDVDPEDPSPLGAGDPLIATYEALGALVDQSLLHQVLDAVEEPRFRLLQPVREIALEMLAESGETELLHRRHALACLAFAEEAAPHLTGPDQARWLASLDRSLDDLRAAMDWLRAHAEHERLLRLAAALWRFGYTRGHLTEARAWLGEARARNPEPSVTRVIALNAGGLLASTQGDTGEATALHEEAMAISEALDHPRGVAVALNGLGDVAAVDGERALARDRYEAALAMFRDLGEERGIAGALTNLGNLAWDARDLDRAVALHEEALARYQEIDERRGIAWSRSNLGTLAAEQGRLGEARTYLRDAHALYEELGDRSGVVLVLEGLAEIAHAQRHPQLEALLHAVAGVVREEIGQPIAPGVRDWHDANIARIRGALGPEFERIWAEGEATSAEDAIATALDLAESTAPATPWRPLTDAHARHGLTAREVDVVRLVAEGRTSKEIAAALHISARTVGTHITHIFEKLNVNTRSAVTAFAHREGLV